MILLFDGLILLNTIADKNIMRIRTLKKRRLLIVIIMVLSLLASASYSVAMPLKMASSECMMEITPCDMCCLMSNPDPQVSPYIDSLVASLKHALTGVPDSIPLPFYHPPG